MTTDKPLACICLPLEPELEARVEESCRLDQVSWAAPLDELIEAIRDADGLLISNRLPIGERVFAAAPRLRVLAGVGVGYDAFDIDAATKRGIAVSNTPDVLTHAVADLVFGLLFALSRHLLENAAYVRSGGWSQAARPPGLGFDIRGRTLGVVGMGRIGRVVTERAQALGMRTLWNDVFSELPADATQSAYRELPDLLRESDVVSLHTDLNPTSHHLIGAGELAYMQPHAVLINTARGPVVDQGALVAALEAGALAACALDVLEQEPPEADDPILELPNALIVPHVGSATRQTRYAMRELAVRNLLAVLNGEPPPTCLNPEVLD
ncbi:MAG: NAD(P)-dependent oxidoreductase [Myxococcota bacterium]|nr:NAD(P)-dependent oxidoreductase [Myxococcota bacterium]